jgi:hypothetical protein
MTSAQRLRVCREGQPVSAFPDHASGAAIDAVTAQLLQTSIRGAASEVAEGSDVDQFFGCPKSSGGSSI